MQKIEWARPRNRAESNFGGAHLSDEQYRALFASIQEGFFVGEVVRDDDAQVVDFRFLEVNEAFTRQTDLHPHEAVDQLVSKVIPGFPSSVVQRYAEVVDAARPAAFEVEIAALEHRVYEARAHPVGGERFAVLFLEITERKRIEKELESSRAHLQAIVDSVDQIVWSARPDGYHDFFNRRMYEFTGVPPGSTDGEAWIGIFHPDDHARTRARWQHSLETGEPYEIEYRMRHRDGTYRWVLGRAHPVRNEAGEILRWMGTCTDIDDARRAQDALRASEQQFRDLADSLPQLAWMADAHGWIYWYNRRWYEYTGTTLEQMQGWGWRKVHHPDHEARVVERIQHAWDTGKAWEDVFPLRGGDGRYRWFLSRASPMKDSEGRVIRWFGTNTDITEKHKVEELQKMLIHEISHRVKNSLALVSSLLSLQARSLHDKPRKALEQASLRVHAVATVHDQLWRQADAQEVDLSPFIRNLAEAVATSAPQHTTVVEAEHAMVSADLAVPIGILLNELLTNAYKYAYPQDGGGEVRVHGAIVEGGRYRLQVIDFGRGLPPDFDISRSRTSLGMRVIRTLADQLESELSAHSEAEGTRFTVVFPLRKRHS